MRRRVAVVGGGFGALAAAGFLARAGAEVTLFEAASALGGKAGRSSSFLSSARTASPMAAASTPRGRSSR